MKMPVSFRNFQYFLGTGVKETTIATKKTTSILKEAFITTQKYNKNLFDNSVSKEIICWLLCDVKVIALEERRNHAMNYNNEATAAHYLYAISLKRYTRFGLMLACCSY